MAKSVTKRFSVQGVVQNVGYRHFVATQAKRLGITGYTTNNFDGSVKIIAQGNSEAIDKLQSLCQKGPSSAHISEVIESRVERPEMFADFSIRF